MNELQQYYRFRKPNKQRNLADLPANEPLKPRPRILEEIILSGGYRKVQNEYELNTERSTREKPAQEPFVKQDFQVNTPSENGDDPGSAGLKGLTQIPKPIALSLHKRNSPNKESLKNLVDTYGTAGNRKKSFNKNLL